MGFDLPVMNRLRRSGRALSPASLFATGAQGVIYDPRDLSTMFQDSLGTTPVTAPGQTVGLRLDKSGRGNHATQATAGARLTYGIEPKTGTRNILTQTEAFNEAVWTKAASTVTANAVTSPDGSLTADTITATSAYGNIYQGVTTSATSVTVSVYAKSNTFGQLGLLVTNNPNSSANYAQVLFNTTNGTFIAQDGAGSIYSVTSYSILPVGNGWYRLSVTAGITTGTSHFVLLGLGASAVNGSSVYVWGAQLETGAVATPYQKVVTAFEVTEAGVPTCHYCAYAGANSMATSAIDFTATDKMSIFAGVRKVSTGPGILVELSSDSLTNNGAFGLFAPSGFGGDYYYNSRGTVSAPFTTGTGTYVPPINNIITGISDISGDLGAIRVNGIQVAQTTNNQGTGNYGNYPLYFGRQAGSTLPFTGRDYGIVIVGKATSAAEINITEAWLAANTPTVVL